LQKPWKYASLAEETYQQDLGKITDSTRREQEEPPSRKEKPTKPVGKDLIPTLKERQPQRIKEIQKI